MEDILKTGGNPGYPRDNRGSHFLKWRPKNNICQYVNNRNQIQSLIIGVCIPYHNL